MKAKSRVITGAFLVCIGLWVTLPERGVSQTGQPPAELISAQAYKADGFQAEALPLLDQIQRTYPGSPYDLASRFDKAHIVFTSSGNLGATKAVYSSIAQDFPTTLEATVARINLADIRYLDEKGSFSSYLQELDAIASSLGGPTVTSIADGNLDQQILSRPGLEQSVQLQCLAEVYDMASSRLTGQKQVAQADALRSLNLLVFYGDKCAGVIGEQFTEAFDFTVRIRDGVLNPDFSKDKKPPKISQFKVKRTKDDKYVVIASVSDDFGISSSLVTLSLDGQKLTARPEYRFRALNKKVKNLDRSDLRAVFKVELPALSQGRHVMVCEATDLAGNVASKSRSFKFKVRDCEMEQFDSEDENGDDF